jgi:hypothetical protein
VHIRQLGPADAGADDALDTAFAGPAFLLSVF